MNLKLFPIAGGVSYFYDPLSAHVGIDESQRGLLTPRVCFDAVEASADNPASANPKRGLGQKVAKAAKAAKAAKVAASAASPVRIAKLPASAARILGLGR